MLAHSFYPVYGGDVHFDEEESWVGESHQRGTHLKYVAAHEIGHALGLPHINRPGALMAPTINTQNNVLVALSPSDVEAIQKLYGKKSAPASTPSPRTPSPAPPTLCDEADLKAVVSDPERPVFVKAGGVWRQGEAERLDSRDVWPGLARTPDTGFIWNRALTYVFVGKIDRTSPHLVTVVS